MKTLHEIWNCNEDGRPFTPEEEWQEWVRRARIRAVIDAILVSIIWFYLTIAGGVDSILFACIGLATWPSVLSIPFRVLDIRIKEHDAQENAVREEQNRILRAQRKRRALEQIEAQEKTRRQNADRIYREMMSKFVIDDP